MPTSVIPGPSSSSIVATPPFQGPVEDGFVDRRAPGGSHIDRERRQFANSYSELSPAARELATAVDQYKVRHRRRFINYEEMLSIVHELGYKR